MGLRSLYAFPEHSRDSNQRTAEQSKRGRLGYGVAQEIVSDRENRQTLVYRIGSDLEPGEELSASGQGVNGSKVPGRIARRCYLPRHYRPGARPNNEAPQAGGAAGAVPPGTRPTPGLNTSARNPRLRRIIKDYMVKIEEAVGSSLTLAARTIPKPKSAETSGAAS